MEGKKDAGQLSLNQELYTNAGRHFVGILSPKSRHLLTLPAEKRTGAAFSDLLFELEDIKFFKTFPNRTKELLAKKLMFISRRADEILLKQGETDDPPQALYIIVSGVITERYQPVNSRAWPEKILLKGDFFGHVDIVYNRPPSVDAMTVGYAEFLMLKKEDFYIIRGVMEAHSSQVEHYLRTTETITRFGWSDEEYKVLEIYSKLSTYAENMDVYEGTGKNSKPSCSYFVVSGRCRIMREIAYYAQNSNPKHLKAIPYEQESELKNPKVIKELLEVEEVKQGYYFGVGENFGRNRVVADSTLECLLIPRLILLFKNNELLLKMAHDLTVSQSADQEILDNYSRLMTACERKMEMLRNLFKDKPERLVEN